MVTALLKMTLSNIYSLHSALQLDQVTRLSAWSFLSSTLIISGPDPGISCQENSDSGTSDGLRVFTEDLSSLIKQSLLL